MSLKTTLFVSADTCHLIEVAPVAAAVKVAVEPVSTIAVVGLVVMVGRFTTVRGWDTPCPPVSPVAPGVPARIV